MKPFSIKLPLIVSPTEDGGRHETSFLRFFDEDDLQVKRFARHAFWMLQLPSSERRRRIWLVVFLLCAQVFAQEPPVDLGIVTARKPILIHGCQRRVDFQHFVIRIPATGDFQTNDLVLTNITGILNVNDELRSIYPGAQILEVHSICTDGESSETNFFKFNLQRLRPSKPVAESPTPGPSPPMPPGFTNVKVTNANSQLPDAMSETSYEYYRARLERAQKEGRRRSQ